MTLIKTLKALWVITGVGIGGYLGYLSAAEVSSVFLGMLMGAVGAGVLWDMISDIVKED